MIKCPKCNRPDHVVCRGRRHTMYPSGCLALIGPLLAVIHQASTPVDFKCLGCGREFGRRSTAAKIVLAAIVLFIIHLVVVFYQNIQRVP